MPTTTPPELIDLLGEPVDRVDTPAALVELDVFEGNAARIHRYLDDHGRTWRPHSKAHKAPFLAHLQLAAGAIGVTCAKVAEAEVMVANGIPDVLVANEPGTPVKWIRVAALQRSANVIACVDDVAHVLWAAKAARAAEVTIPLFIEVDIGMRRAGVTSHQAAIELADRIALTDGVRLAGLMGYEGHLPAVRPREDKLARCVAALNVLVSTVQKVRAAGHDVDIVSSGGSGTFEATAELPELTECQAGGGCLMDRFYGELCEIDFDYALTLRATTISVQQPGRAIVDAGFKALGRLSDIPLPRVINRRGVAVVGLSAEHGILSDENDELVIGEQVELIPGYSDAMLLLHDHLIGHRGGVVTDVIPLLGRGRLT
jgi:D-serine deaminase-like pyridoxal phosphate-dependent protein